MNEILCEKQNLKILSVGSLFVLKTKYMYVLIINIVPDNTISFFFFKEKPPTLCHLVQVHMICTLCSQEAKSLCLCVKFLNAGNFHLYVNFNCKISNVCSLKN